MDLVIPYNDPALAHVAVVASILFGLSFIGNQIIYRWLVNTTDETFSDDIEIDSSLKNILPLLPVLNIKYDGKLNDLDFLLQTMPNLRCLKIVILIIFNKH
ncbi:unnamed protein product [Rotaria sordida]|uniref:Uncharacterized protein n=1 Tax=Rotaria sordida TaxID=392033 RepID=A0A818UFK6_9BILA|nr:unnamed protein product [Rotaria sordida]